MEFDMSNMTLFLTKESIYKHENAQFHYTYDI